MSRTNLTIRTNMTITITGIAVAGKPSGTGGAMTRKPSGAGGAMTGQTSAVMPGTVMTRSCTSSDSLTAQSSLHSFWFTLEAVDSLASAGKSSALSLELAEADRRESRSRVNDGLIVMYLVNRHSGVDDRRLNDLLLKNRLDGLMDVMVNMFAGNGRTLGLGVDRRGLYASIVELGTLFLKTTADGSIITMVDVTLLHSGHDMLVLFRKHLLVVHRLDGGVVVVLVDLTVNGGLDLIVTGSLDSLLGNGRVDDLVDGGILVTGLVHEFADGCFGLIHCDDEVR
jgi:hypothetical protein